MSESVTESVYNFIADYISQHTYGPSHREIARACFISVGAVGTHLTRLEKQDRIVRDMGVARGIRLVEKNTEQMPEHLSNNY